MNIINFLIRISLKMDTKAVIVIFSFFSIILAGIFLGYVSASDTEMILKEKTIAQNKVCEANFDKMFKTIAQVAQVPDQFIEKSKQAFIDIYPQLIKGRYDNSRGGSLMSWVTESNPQFDIASATSMYSNIQKAIEVNRQEFFAEQRRLIEFKRAHTTFINKFINKNLYRLGSRDFDIVVITSETTEQVYKSGQENNIELFN